MKIYKLDIDTSKPIRKVVQMQQNSTGALSVDVSNDGKYIRNLSCALYDGGNEVSAYATGDNSAGYKLDIGDETKVLKFTAKSIPNECSATNWTGNGSRAQNKWYAAFQLSAGVYHQDEFAGIAKKFGADSVWAPSGLPATIVGKAGTLTACNFDKLFITLWNEAHPYWFLNSSTGKYLSQDEDIVVTDNVEFGMTKSTKATTQQSYTYPAVGYWTDYSLETVIRPSENAHCYAEQDIADPTPDPEPEPTPDPDDPPAETTEE